MGRYVKDEAGVSVITVVLLMLMMAVMGSVMVSMVVTEGDSSVNQMRVTQAHYIAETGIERVLRYLLKREDGVCTVCTCASINGHPSFTNIPVGAGTFTVTSQFNYSNPAASVAAGLNSVDTSIPVGGMVGYANYGRIMIDREMIDCLDLTVNPLGGCLRGVDQTAASAHAAGTRIGHHQCLLASTGRVITSSLKTAERVIQVAVTLQEGWAVGAQGDVPGPCPNTNARIVRWTGSDWNCVNSPSDRNLNSVSMLSYADGFAVGDSGGGGNARIARWDGTAWADIASPVNRKLNSVHMVSSVDGYAVGDSGGGAGPCPNSNGRIIRWNGAVWNCMASPLNENLNGVFMLDTNNDGIADDGWGVGVNWGNHPLGWTFIRWDGASWNFFWVLSFGTSADTLNSVHMVSPNDGFAVGDSGGGDNARILRWNGVSWGILPSPSNRNLNSVFVIDRDNDGIADDGFAVGDSGGGGPGGCPSPNNARIIRWTGAAWVPVCSPTGDNLNSVYMVSSKDAWAVGDNGVIIHWDGISWSLDPESGNVNRDLLGLSIVHPAKADTDWREIY